MSWQWPVEGSVLQEWADRYVRENYRAVGLVNIISRDTTDYYLPLTAGSAPVGQNYILICERRDLYSIGAESVEFGPGFDSRSGSEKNAQPLSGEGKLALKVAKPR
jgi:hypothetical protein